MIEGLPFKATHKTYGRFTAPFHTCEPRAKPPRKKRAPKELPPTWSDEKQKALGRLLNKVTNLLEGDGDLREQINDLEVRLNSLEQSQPSQCGSFGTFINSLGHPQVSVKKPIPVTIRSDG